MAGRRCALNRKHCPKGQYARDLAITTNAAVGTGQCHGLNTCAYYLAIGSKGVGRAQ
jgi:hypothetical protein